MASAEPPHTPELQFRADPPPQRSFCEGFLLTPLAEDTELVAFGVCQDNPRLLALADVDTLCAMGHKTSDLGVLIIQA